MAGGATRTDHPVRDEEGMKAMRKKIIIAVACAAAAGLGPLAASGVHASAALQSPVGNQSDRQFDTAGGCYADFSITESPQQSLTAVTEPTVTALTFTVSLHCSGTDLGWDRVDATMAGGAIPQSCDKGAAFNVSTASATASCTIVNPPPGVYTATGTATAPSDAIADSLTEVVLPGDGVPGLPDGIGNRSTTTNQAPCHMTSSITESPQPQTTNNPLAQVWTVAATAHMACDYSIYEPDYAAVTLVSPTGSTCSASTPTSFNSNTSFTAGCSLAAEPGQYLAVFHYVSYGPTVAGPIDTYAALGTVVL
jgi:hypothetical protein